MALELGIHALSGRREAWDSPLYRTLGLPAVQVVKATVSDLKHNTEIDDSSFSRPAGQ